MPAKVGQVDTSSLAVGSPAMAALQSNPAVIPTKPPEPQTQALQQLQLQILELVRHQFKHRQ